LILLNIVILGRISSDTLKHLHALCQSASGDAGQFKRIDNEVIELVPGAAPVIRFKCVSAKQTPAAVDELCLLYRHALDQDNLPPLIAIAGLVLHFLCIHPFRDGNGRVSRLLTLLALYQHGYEVGRYLSLERLIEESKEDYYECLNRSSRRWHEGKHELTPWTNFLFAIIRRGYAEFEKRAGQVKAPRGAKAETVLNAICRQQGDFRLTEIEHACPGVGREWIRSLLSDLKAAGEVSCRGKGPAARWQYLGSKGSNP
jgi:Fic family protein